MKKKQNQMIFDKKKCWFLVKNIIDFVSILGNLTTQIAIIVIIFIFFSSQLSVFELLKWHTYIIVSSNGLKLQSLSRNMLHLRSKTHVEYLIISISNYSMLNVNNCNNFHNRGSCKFHKGNWLHTIKQDEYYTNYKYRKVASTSLSCFEAHAGLYRLLMKGILMLMYCNPLAKSLFLN